MPGPRADVTIAGSGAGARALAEALRTVEIARLRAFAGGQGARAAAACHGVEAFASVEEALAAAPPGILAVSTPSHLHAEHAARGLDAGWDVLVDKPLALCAQEARALRTQATRVGRRLGVVHQYRCDPAHAFVTRLLGEPACAPVLGASVRLDAGRDRAYYRAAAWRGDRGRGGGCVWNQGFHVWDLVTWWLGPVRVERAELSLAPWAGVDQDVVCDLRAADGTPVRVEVRTSASCPHRLTAEIQAARAHAVVLDHQRASWSADDPGLQERLDTHASHLRVGAGDHPPGASYAVLIAAFLAGRPVAAADDAIAAIELVEAIYEAAS